MKFYSQIFFCHIEELCEILNKGNLVNYTFSIMERDKRFIVIFRIPEVIYNLLSRKEWYNLSSSEQKRIIERALIRVRPL